MKNVLKQLAGVLLASVIAIAGAGCGRQETPPADYQGPVGTVTASGSTALLHLVTAASELFMENYEWVEVAVSGGGSFNGLTQVASGAVDIGNSDIEATAEQAEGLVDHKVAVSPFIIIVNKDVTVDNVTLDQLAKIFRGEIKNWSEVGGSDVPIQVISRPQSSGSRVTIVETVLKGQGDITVDAIVQDSNGKVRDGVATTPGAIGYVDAPYFQPDQVNALKVDGVAYSPEAVIHGQWPIYAYGHMYTKGEPKGATKAFLDYILSDEFQGTYVEQLGFIPVTKMAQTEL